MVKVTLEVAIAFTHASVALAFCWPPPIVATKRQVIIFKLVRFLLTLNGALLLLAFLHAIYANEVSRVSRYAVVTVVGVATVGLIVSAITFVSQQQSVALKGQYVLLSLTTFLEVFLCAWPADHLMTMSCDVAQAAYDSQWYTQPKNFQKNILHIILKCQKPITVTVGGVMQALSLNYCGMFVTNAYSFFTTLRNTIDRKNTDET
ncbi:hypothetical protein KM043_018415 [Ampulex compressa]|nr:hypothetical protein KM043_018415 [Ampulex compressa]